jgi:uncharacterized protein (DUF4213/DUF364 family)
MSISSNFIELVEHLSDTIEIPLIESVFFPKKSRANHIKSRKDNFGAIKLADGSIGIVFIALSPGVREKGAEIKPNEYYMTHPVELAKNFGSSDLFERTLGLGAINAISQFVFRKSDFQFDFTTDSLGLLQLNNDDKIGMVGFFPPLVKQIERKSIPLIVIEKKEHLVRKTENWEVTLDSDRLKECNKVLITSTTVLNNTVDDILIKCSEAERISLIGPTAGFLPDPLFNRNVQVVGSTYIHNSKLFMELVSKNERWGPSTKKYCIQKQNYGGYLSLIENLD